MLKSYYEILNVKPNATHDEIKNQYRKLVRMYHPDVNSSLEAEQIFKEVNKAAEILLDCEKRKNYDNLRSLNKKIYKSTNSFYDNLQNKKNNNKKAPLEPLNGSDITLCVTIDYFEALIGTKRTVNISKTSPCQKCSGYKFANNQKCPYCFGSGQIVENKKITLKIPPKIKDGTKLRIKGEGQTGINGGKDGNLYVIVKIEGNDELKIKDGIVYYEAQISPYTAVLGGSIKVPTLWGEATIKIPPLTKANQSFKLIDVGVLNEKTSKKGDEIVKIIIQIPNSLSQEEYQLYEKLKEINLKKKNARTINEY